MPKKNVVTINDFPSPDDARISAAFKSLISGRNLNPVQVGLACELSKSALYDRLKGAVSWKAHEVTNIARYFGVKREDLYDGLGGRVGPPLDGPLAQSVELRTFNPLSGLGEIAKVIPIRRRHSLQDVSLLTATQA